MLRGVPCTIPGSNPVPVRLRYLQPARYLLTCLTGYLARPAAHPRTPHYLCSLTCWLVRESQQERENARVGLDRCLQSFAIPATGRPLLRSTPCQTLSTFIYLSPHSSSYNHRGPRLVRQRLEDATKDFSSHITSVFFLLLRGTTHSEKASSITLFVQAFQHRLCPWGSLPFTQHHVSNHRGSLRLSQLPFDFAPGHVPGHVFEYLTNSAATSCPGSDGSHATAPGFRLYPSVVRHEHVVCLTHVTAAFSGLNTRHSRRHLYGK